MTKSDKKIPPRQNTRKKENDLLPVITQKGDLITVTIKFRNDSNGGHNHVIVDDIDDNHVSVSLTTKKKKGKNSTNFKLETSPLSDGKDSYMRRQGTVHPKKSYRNPRQGKMTINDYARAKAYGERAKQKYLNQKNAKKNNDVPNT